MNRDICLCLSGGGYRAAIYHLGALRWLNEQGVLHSTLYIVWADGSGLERSIPLPWEAYSLAWSPTEEKLLLRSIAQGQEAVYVLSLKDNELTQVYGSSRVLVWSPDGQTIYFSSNRGGGFAIYRKSLEGAGEVEEVFVEQGKLIVAEGP